MAKPVNVSLLAIEESICEELEHISEYTYSFGGEYPFEISEGIEKSIPYWDGRELGKEEAHIDNNKRTFLQHLEDRTACWGAAFETDFALPLRRGRRIMTLTFRKSYQREDPLETHIMEIPGCPLPRLMYGEERLKLDNAMMTWDEALAALVPEPHPSSHPVPRY